MKNNYLLYEEDEDKERYDSIAKKLAKKYMDSGEDSIKNELLSYFDVESVDELWDDEVGNALAVINGQQNNEFIRSFAYKVLSNSDIDFIRKNKRFKSDNEAFWNKLLVDMGKFIVRIFDPEYVSNKGIEESRKPMNEDVNSNRYFITVGEMIEGEMGNVDDASLDNDIRKFYRISKYLKANMDDVVVFIDYDGTYDPDYYKSELGMSTTYETLYGKYDFGVYEGDYLFCCEKYNGNIYFYAKDEENISNYLNDVDKLNNSNGIFEAFNKDDGSGPYWYFTTHGVGPGSVPRDIEILDVREGENRNGTLGDFFLSNKVLTTKELEYYDCIELSPLEEGTEKIKDHKWVNRGKEGDHGEFNTKKEADAQRKAMFANGYHESYGKNILPNKVRAQANAICNKYNGWHEPRDISPMWDELSELGIEVLIMGYPHKEESGSKMWTVSFDYNGEPCDNSRFVYSVYEGSNSLSNEYVMYFS